MRLVDVYSHLNGLEWLQVNRATLWDEIREEIEAVDADLHRSKRSKEKGRRGQLLISPPSINAALKARFEARGWEGRRTSFFVTDDYELTLSVIGRSLEEQRRLIEEAGRRPLPSYNETDFVKDGVGVEVQFGKYSFIAYDLFVKHMAFFVNGEIALGVEILPMKEMQDQMSSGPGYYEKTLYDLARQGRGVPAVPLLIIGIAP